MDGLRTPSKAAGAGLFLVLPSSTAVLPSKDMVCAQGRAE